MVEGKADDQEEQVTENRPEMPCDYCPNTVFSGTVCPTCGYDYSEVADDFDPDSE